MVIFFGKKFLHNKFGKNIDQNLITENKIPNSGDIIEYNGKYSIFFEYNNSKIIYTTDINDNLDIIVLGNRNNNYNVYNNLEQDILNDGSKLDLKNLLDTYVLK